MGDVVPGANFFEGLDRPIADIENTLAKLMQAFSFSAKRNFLGSEIKSCDKHPNIVPVFASQIFRNGIKRSNLTCDIQSRFIEPHIT